MNLEYLFESAFKLHAAGNLHEAASLYRRMLTKQPANVLANHYLGILLHQQGETATGLELIKSALATDAGSAERYNDLGNILVQISDLDNAITAFQASLELNGEDANVWNNLGSAFHRKSLIQEAEHAYRQALRYAPNFVPALNNLASVLSETGQDEESSRLISLAYIQPPLTEKPLKLLGIAYFRLGRLEEAAACYRTWLGTEPDNIYAKVHLAACTGENIPSKSPEQYVATVFNDMADFFEEKLLSTLSYSGPEVIADLLARHIDKTGDLTILDGGCGTGLIAPVVSPYARHLVGVDLSPGMLAKARAKNVYNDLVESDITAYLDNCRQSFDLIVMADTLIYFGDLHELFAAVKRCINPSGFFTFTIELNEITENQSLAYHLHPTGRYSHNIDYLNRALIQQQFSILESHETILRTEFGKPIMGLGILAYAERTA